MRLSLLLAMSLLCTGCCLFPDRHYTYASNLSRPSKAQLLLWPDDPEGKAFRRLVSGGGSASTGWDRAPLVQDLEGIEDELGAVAMLVPRHASPALLARSEELLGAARRQFPQASYHHLRARFDLFRVDRGRHLLAKLREFGGGSQTLGAFAEWGLFSMSSARPNWLLTARSGPAGLEWVRVDVTGPPKVVRVGDLQEVLGDLPRYRNVFLLSPRGAPPRLVLEVLDACLAQPGWRAKVVAVDTDQFGYDDTELDEDGLAQLYPDFREVTQGPFMIVGRSLLRD